ncbi:acyltransferase [Herbaspirillum sp. DW155]|uniref:acyltransferase family protein n=1 Tax=Herbaspirillum sp. DW155 TaxID=3095609 RepID=UPI003091AE0A|nr:acyltransferase [Herbaspirillum sp. DW155]
MKLGLGTWRFFLAFVVVISHLWKDMIGGPAAYAVWGFYILSGFLMAHVLRFKYGQEKAGLRDYAINRFLRIYPAYAIAMAVGALSLYFLPRMGILPSALNPQFVRPHGAFEWLSNIFLLPVPTPGLFVPVAGALAVEVGAYVLMPLMAFSRSATWLGLILSIAFNFRLGFALETFGDRYSGFLTCFMAFACGALLSHYREPLARFRAPVLSTLVWLLHGLVWLKYDPWPWTYGVYFSLVLSGWVVLSLAPRKTGHLDTVLGDLSYPVYLFHTTAAIWLLPLGVEMRTFSFFALAFVITLVVSWLVVRLVDKPLAGLKKKRTENLEKA